MNNIIHLSHLDPIFNEYEAFVDKGAGLKTIAFKYFGADIQKALEYLDIRNMELEKPINNNEPIISLVENKDYYQPELLH